MGAREDLQAVAERLAVQARVYVDPPKPKGAQPPMPANHSAAASLAHGAKAALEAARLVDAEPAPIIAASERLVANLELLGVESGIEIAAQFGAAEAIDAVTELVGDLIGVARRNVALQTAYQELDELTERLQVDFEAAGSETSTRIAARIHSAREAARTAMKNTRTGG